MRLQLSKTAIFLIIKLSFLVVIMEIETGFSRKRGIQTYSENPFWRPYEVKVGEKMIRVGGGRHISEDGEEVAHSGIHIIKNIDKDEFIKLYTRNVRAIFELKPVTQKVLQYLLVAIQKTPNADGIYLAWLDAEKYFGEEHIKVSRTSFQRSLRELIQKEFIAESTSPNLYWFNPHLFFNGDRMTFIREYRLRR